MGALPFSGTPIRKSSARAIIKMILATNSVDVNAKDNSGRTPLVRAVYWGDWAILGLLAKIGRVDIDPTDEEDRTPPVVSC